MATYAVIDHATHNILGEYAEAELAEALVRRLVEADPSAERDLEIRLAGAVAPELTASAVVA